MSLISILPSNSILSPTDSRVKSRPNIPEVSTWFQISNPSDEEVEELVSSIRKKFEGDYQIHVATNKDPQCPPAPYQAPPFSKPREIWIIDDSSRPDGFPPSNCMYFPTRLFTYYKSVIVNAHKKGGLVFVISRHSIKEESQLNSYRCERQQWGFNRREENVFNLEKPTENIPIYDLSCTKYTHDKNKLTSLSDLVRHSPILTLPVFNQLQKIYPKLKVEGFLPFSMYPNYNTTLLVDNLTPEELDDLYIDLSFYQKHPNTAIENIGCRLNNYTPQNPEQKRILSEVKELANIPNLNKRSGYFLYGLTRTGKTHLAIALAKELIKRKFDVFFITEETEGSNAFSIMKENQVWIIDDIFHTTNSNRIYRDAILNAYEKGGMVFVTSHHTLEEVNKQEEVSYNRYEKIVYISQKARILFGIEAESDINSNNASDSAVNLQTPRRPINSNNASDSAVNLQTPRRQMDSLPSGSTASSTLHAEDTTDTDTQVKPTGVISFNPFDFLDSVQMNLS